MTSSGSVPPTMRAAIYSAFSDDSKEFSVVSVGQVAVPNLGSNDVLVRVLRAALNPADVMLLAGVMTSKWPQDMPFTLGYDFSGVVAAVGDGVKRFSVGEEVWAVNWGQANHSDKSAGHIPGGAFAEYIKIPASLLSKKPSSVSHDQAAALPLVGSTAHEGLFTHLQVQPGWKLLILGGASAVGFIATQLAKSKGVDVTVTCSSRSVEFVQTSKPDHIIDYTKAKWWEGGTVYDAIFDTVGEAEGFAHAKLCLKPDGAFVSIANFDAGVDPKAHLPLRAFAFVFSNNVAVQDELIALVQSKQLIVPIDSTFPFTTEGVRTMLRKQAEGKSLGKNVLAVVGTTTTLPQTMRAAFYADYSTDAKEFSAISVGQLPVPSLGSNDVLVRVIRAALNPVDAKVMFGFMKGSWPQTLPQIVGYDFSGEVVAVGTGVNNFQFGEEVWAVNWGQGNHGGSDGHVPGGAFADYIKIPAQKLSKKPAGISHDVAAALGLVGTTAHEGLFEHLKVQKGTKLLILGGSSAVGFIATQLAKSKGVDVTVTSSTRSSEFVQQAKPDRVIDYTKTKWWEGGVVYDAVFDTVGEKEGFAHAKLVVKPDGAFVSIANFDCGMDPKAHLPLYAYAFCLSNNVIVQDELIGLVQSKQLIVPIDSSYPFTTEGVREMFIKQESGKSLGKNVLIVA